MLDLPPTLLWVLAALLGLCLGSFLNVVIVRLPVMLMLGWRQEAREALAYELPPSTAEPALEGSERFDLSAPRSHCPSCKSDIAWHDNVPLLGYLKRRGRCAHCGVRIGLQYPLVELASLSLTLAIAAIHGFSVSSLFLVGACLALLALAIIDLRTQLLPDVITLPLLWAGLTYQLLFQPLMLPSAVIGAMLGYVTLWSFHWAFMLVTGKQGMGYGDFKLMAALGAWLGWEMLPLMLVLAAGTGAVVGIAMQAWAPRLRGLPMPFGPFLAMAGWIALLGGAPLQASYQALLS